MPVRNFVRRSVYQDSVTLMRLTRDLEAVAGVRRAAAMMGTPANRALLGQAGLLVAEGEAAGPVDLVIAVAADDDAVAEAAAAAAVAALATPRAAPAAAASRPRTLAAALRALPGASLALISVPGIYAGAEARRALDAGLHVMIFSDNVPLETEVELKRLARERGRFLLGPDCGTAIVAGVPLGFANVVPPGRIGVVAASGTGLQEVTCRLAAEGEGVSHALGVGSRDLTDAVGGIMTLAALAALAADPATEVIVVLGKPPGPAAAARLTGALAALGKPCVAHFPGDDRATPATAATLEDAALAAVALARGRSPRAAEFSRPAAEVDRLVAEQARALTPGQRFVRGVYSGGTLAWEAVAVLSAQLDGVAPGVLGSGAGHRIVDLGDDVFTVGRPHPMIDGAARRERIAREAADSATAVLLLDVVLGYGAHPDPAGELAPALRAARSASIAAGRGLAIVASVTGTEGDPQTRSAQVAALLRAGALVMDSNAQAARLAARIAAAAPGAR
ncbi:MAG TPA: acyl-CoA synthetase FdrA [Methylomirabilota bacterium]|nr:acyl-CoA synthetase FdrA [Methylomirabilota bacterium]